MGEVSANDLARNFADLDAISKASTDQLQEIDGIGPSVAERLPIGSRFHLTSSY